MLRKRRTREHVIADLSVNYFERFVLRRGHVVLPIAKDYGYDLAIYTHNAEGEPEAGNILVQLKATDAFEMRQNGANIRQVLDCRDLRYWRLEVMPVLLVVYDAQAEQAYWLYMQDYLRDTVIPEGQTTLTAIIPRENVVGDEAIEQFRDFKARILRQAEGVLRHED